MSKANLAILNAVWVEAVGSITHKCHDEGHCDCEAREANAGLAISWLTKNGEPEVIAKMLKRALLPDSLRALMAEYPQVMIEVPEAAWRRCLPQAKGE